MSVDSVVLNTVRARRRGAADVPLNLPPAPATHHQRVEESTETRAQRDQIQQVLSEVRRALLSLDELASTLERREVLDVPEAHARMRTQVALQVRLTERLFAMSCVHDGVGGQLGSLRHDEAAQLVPASSGSSGFQQSADELGHTGTRLHGSRIRADQLETSRRDLISWVSHDLRSPLAGMRAMAEALEDGLAKDPNRYHRQIRSEVDRMIRMVDDIFGLSLIHAGNLVLAPARLMVGDLVSEAIASADPVARSNGVRLVGAVEQGLDVIADPVELSRMISNLLMNAIRHTPAEGVVEVLGRLVPTGIELTIKDGCGGLTTEEIERAFDLAWQGRTARTPGPGSVLGSGAGLGLAIVRGIVEAHRGTVSVANQDPGCRFQVCLPT